jgi:hypothetical protein
MQPIKLNASSYRKSLLEKDYDFAKNVEKCEYVVITTTIIIQ